MKHKPCIIRYGDLYDRCFDKLDVEQLEEMGLQGPGGFFNEEMKNKWWVVLWPEHCTATYPEFNGDAAYHGPFDSERDAREYR